MSQVAGGYCSEGRGHGSREVCEVKTRGSDGAIMKKTSRSPLGQENREDEEDNSKQYGAKGKQTRHEANRVQS